jgi:hypothetical protein
LPLVVARKIRSELDPNRQGELIKDFQRQAAVIQPVIMSIGTSTGFDLSWPWLQNYGAWTGFPSVHLKAYYWYDKSRQQKPA